MKTKVKETKNKVVTFVKEHEALLVTTGLVVCGTVIGYNLNTLKRVATNDVRIVHKGIRDTLIHAQKNIGDSNWSFTGNIPEALKPEDLGKLGKRMLEHCTNGEKPVFTHFIAIGPNNN